MIPNESEIREAVNASGYLFEQKVAYKLKNKGYIVTPNHNFEDVDTGQSREIDVHAISGIAPEGINIEFWQTLLVECKKNKNPFVFFSKPKTKKYDVFDDYLNIVGVPENLETDKKPGILSLEKCLNLGSFSHRSTLKDISSQFCTVVQKGKGWEAKHDFVYDGIILPLIKCLSYERNEYKKMLSRKTIQLKILYPIVVVDSDLYLMNSETNALAKKKWILLQRHFDSKNLKLNANIEFVRYNYLDQYIDMIDTAFYSILREIENNQVKLMSVMKAKKFYDD